MTIHVDTSAETPASKSRVFVFSGGFVFSTQGVVTTPTERFYAMLLLATDERQPFEIDVDGHKQRLGAVAIKPFVMRSLNAHKVPFVSIGISPAHPAYRTFSLLDQPGFMSLPRELFINPLRGLADLLETRTGLNEAIRLFHECVDVVTALLPHPKPLDARIERALQWLKQDPAQGLDTLSDRACLSYHRLSHLFTQEMGVSLRQYLPTYKIIAAVRALGQGMSVTDAAHASGFSDSAHLSRVWAKAFGAPPSFFLNSDSISLYPPPKSGPATVAITHTGITGASSSPPGSQLGAPRIQRDFADSVY